MREFNRKPYLTDDYFTLKMFNPVGVKWFEANKPYYDDEYLSNLDYQSYQFQTSPFFETVNRSIQDPYIDDFIQPSTDPFTEKGSDKTGVLGKIGFDDDLKKVDEGEEIDPVTGHPLLELEVQTNAQFELIENNQSSDKYSWLVKESGTVQPRQGAFVTLTAPNNVPVNEEPIQIYLFNEQHQLDYVNVEITPLPVMLLMKIDKEGYESCAFVWNISSESFSIDIGVYENSAIAEWVGKTEIVGNELWTKTELSERCIDRSHCGHGYYSNLSDIVGADGESLYCWCSDRYNWYDPTWINNDYMYLTNPYFSSFSLEANNESGYAGSVRTDVVGDNAYMRNGGSVYKIVTPIGEFGEIGEIGDSDRPYFVIGGFDDFYQGILPLPTGQWYRRGITKGQYSDNVMSQLYLSQYMLTEPFPTDRIVQCRAQVAIVDDGNSQSPREMDRTPALEEAVVALVEYWYLINGFREDECASLISSILGKERDDITWELRG